MVFKKLAAIIDSKKAIHPTLREAAVLEKAQDAWKTKGLTLFKPHERKHLEKNVAVKGYQKGVVIFFASDAQAAATLHLKKTALLGALRGDKGQNFKEIQIQIRRT